MSQRKYAILTEGEGEYASLDRLYPEIHRATTNIRLLSPIKVPVAPDASPRRIANACVPALKLSSARGADAAVLLLDREQAVQPAVTLAARIQEELERLDILPTHVILKDRMYENWLVADIDALAGLTGRFNITSAMRARVAPDKADECNALDLLKTAAIKKPYHKVQDAKRICSVLRIGQAAANSRSFRRLLQTVRHSAYLHQSERPAAPSRIKRRGQTS